MKHVRVSLEEARRIAVRAQLLDGSARGVRETVRALGFLQIDPIATVTPPQYLVPWSRLGNYDPAELDRLLWEERTLFEWNAFIYPIEDLPLIQARMRRRRGKYTWERRSAEFLRVNGRFKRYVLNELAVRGPLLSRELEDRSSGGWDSGGWYGNRDVSIMLDILHGRGEVAIVGRRGGQRLWGLAADWYPATEKVSLRDAERIIADRRFRARRRRPRQGRVARASRGLDGPVPDRVTLLSPFDRLIYDGIAPRRSGASATGSRCTCRRRSASTATTCSRSVVGDQGRRPRRAGVRPEDEDARARRRLGRHLAARRGARRARGMARRRADQPRFGAPTPQRPGLSQSE